MSLPPPIYGFTGTRHLTDVGRQNIDVALRGLPADATLVVGGCVGADAYAGARAALRGLTVHVVLPSNRSQVDPGWARYASSHEEGGDYRRRNERIVALASHLLAFPNHPEGQDNPRSGTWMTIRIARTVGVPITVTPQHE